MTAFICIVLTLQIPDIKIDTDPENMLSEDEVVRVFHNQIKKEFSLYDMIVLGVVNESHADGVFNPETLRKIYDLTQTIEKMDGVIAVDLIAPSRVDDIQPIGLGTVRFEWLMKAPPENRDEALRIRDRARENPILEGTLLSEDGKAICLYIPLKAKSLSYQIAAQIKEYTGKLQGDEQYHVTGLPVAEDTFGVEMFRQMAVSAPMAGLFIFILMWGFFRNVALVMSAMIVSIVTVLCTMGLLIGTGHTVHIMSSLIPIFLMPIAVVDSIHILSEFFERYPQIGDRRETLHLVMKDLFSPMLFTSLTSAAGFASLALTPIPPVRVFGIFVAVGILLAWVLTIAFLPACVMLLKESSLKQFGSRKEGKSPAMERVLNSMGHHTYEKAKWILILTGAAVVLAIVGISRIQVNDNPVKWFERDHPIRVADAVLNRHFGGTYMAYLVLDEKHDASSYEDFLARLDRSLQERVEATTTDFPKMKEVSGRAFAILQEEIASHKAKQDWSPTSLLKNMESRMTAEQGDAEFREAADELGLFFNEQMVGSQPFKRPDLLRYIERLEQFLVETGAVGKASSVADIIKKVHYELMEGNKEYNVIPNTAAAVAQTLLSYQSSHDPDDLWHLVTPDYDRANIWVQLKSGDNKDMEFVVHALDEFVKKNPPPTELNIQWAGLTYLNVIWQEKMVSGMLKALMGSFVIVLMMMVFLFRSPVWGLLCMIPLTVTITFIYGLIGFAGKDYDMPTSVLSALTLGLSVDFAIHFLERCREAHKKSGDWKSASIKMFGGPARAISRNILVIAVGFTPLMAAPLVPYQTVGIFLASIMIISGLGTLLILPALVRFMESALFQTPGFGGRFCNPVSCVSVSIVAIIIVTYGIHQFGIEGWGPLVWGVALSLTATALICHFVAKREAS